MVVLAESGHGAHVDGTIVRGREEGRSIRGDRKVRKSTVDLIHSMLGGQSVKESPNLYKFEYNCPCLTC
jgi:allantoicase